jgi:uncharacterized membrane-anchored protein
VNLATYLVEPVAKEVGISHGLLMALLTPLVVLGVWLMVRRIRTHLS